MSGNARRASDRGPRQALAELRPDMRVMSAGDTSRFTRKWACPKTWPHALTWRNEPARTASGTPAWRRNRCHHHGRASVFNRSRSVPGAQRVAVQPQQLCAASWSRRVSFETDNDTEVGAAYLTWKMQTGQQSGRGPGSSLDDLDGFFTFVVGTKDGFGVVRDPIACKPAVMAETDQYVAFGSEYRALVNLPGSKMPAFGNLSPQLFISGSQ